jgi:hypothetical protein
MKPDRAARAEDLGAEAARRERLESAVDVLTVMAKVTSELVARGLAATFEYPGCVAVGDRCVFGTDEGVTWCGDVYRDAKAFLEGDCPVRSVVSAIPCESGDVTRVANWIARVMRDLEEVEK